MPELATLEFEHTCTSEDALHASWLYGRSTRSKTLLIVGPIALVALATWFAASIPLALGLLAAAA